MEEQSLKEKWDLVCNTIRQYPNIEKSQVNAFFSRVQPQAMSEDFLMLTADNSFIKNWIIHHYLDSIKQALHDIYGVSFTILVEVNSAHDSRNTLLNNGEENTVKQNNQNSNYLHNTKTIENNNEDNRSGGELIDNKNYNNQHPSSLRDVELYNQNNLVNQNTSTGHTYFKEQNSQVNQNIYLKQNNNTVHTVEDNNLNSENSTVNSTINYKNQEDTTLTNSLTFENFVIGDSNRIAFSMAVAVAEKPGKPALNPLFIYGKSGLGKTHLLLAIKNYINETFPHLTTIYVDSAELLNDYTEAAIANDKEKQSYKNFKHKYELADVLLIDDVQYFQGKKQTLDIVFQIFNKLTQMGKQVVLSADRAPKNIDIDERYQSRFSSGGTFDIQPPEIETKLGVIKSCTEEYIKNEGNLGFQLKNEIQLFIAENSSSNIRELKSAVTKVIYKMEIENKEITTEDVRELLKDHFSGGPSKRLTIADIQKEVENYYRVTRSDLIGSKRSRNIMHARQIAIYLCRKILDLPYGEIGKKFNRDHSTIMYSVTNIEEKLKNNRELREEMEIIKKLVFEN